jgi:outer membrane protein TolC
MRSRQILAEIRDLRVEARARNERSDALLAGLREEVARSRAQHEEAIAAYRSEVELTREVMRRNEIAFQQGGAVLSELVETVREMKEEVRAHTRAIFELLDRLDGGTATA